MSRRGWGGLLAAVSGLVLVGVLAAALIGSALGAPEGLADRVERLAAGMRCPDCQAMSVAESRTAAAATIREEIAAQVAAGRSDDEIRDHFVERYGEWILLTPADPLAWWLPVAVLAAALVAFGLWLRSDRAAPPPGAMEAIAPTDDEHVRRVREELEGLDG